MGGLKFAKPETRKKAKARSAREAAKIVRQVRAACVERDGYCRYGRDAEDPIVALFCMGRSEWAHLNEFARYKTRGTPPAARHRTHGTAMICTRHHVMLHSQKLKLTFLSEVGADGPIAWDRT